MSAETAPQTEASMLERIGNLIEPEAPKAARPAASNDGASDEPPNDDELSLADDESLPGEEPDEPVAPAPDDLYELEIAGEARKLTKAELKDLAEAGHTYKQTAETLKQEREAVQRERQITANIAQLAPQVESLRAEGRILLGVMQGLNQQVQSLMESDPIAAIQAQNQLQQYQARFNQLAQAEGQVSTQVAHLHAQASQAQLQAEIPVLLSKLPKWKDPEVRARDVKFIQEFMTAEGYSPQEIGLASKSHYVTTLLKAARYDQIVKSRASKKVTNAPQLARPGTPANAATKAATERNEYRKAVKTAPSEAQAAKVIQKRLERLL